jgi:hypothetical protein
MFSHFAMPFEIKKYLICHVNKGNNTSKMREIAMCCRFFFVKTAMRIYEITIEKRIWPFYVFCISLLGIEEMKKVSTFAM